MPEICKRNKMDRQRQPRRVDCGDGVSRSSLESAASADDCSELRLIQVFFPPDPSRQSTGDVIMAARSESGPELKWKCRANEEYGPPGSLAQQLHKLILTCWLREDRPDILLLQSLREICAELGVGNYDTGSIQWALHQNASMFFVAERCTTDRRDRSRRTEMGFTPYSVAIRSRNGGTDQMARIEMHWCYRSILNEVLGLQPTGRTPLELE